MEKVKSRSASRVFVENREIQDILHQMKKGQHFWQAVGLVLWFNSNRTISSSGSPLTNSEEFGLGWGKCLTKNTTQPSTFELNLNPNRTWIWIWRKLSFFFFVFPPCRFLEKRSNTALLQIFNVYQTPRRLHHENDERSGVWVPAQTNLSRF